MNTIVSFEDLSLVVNRPCGCFLPITCFGSAPEPSWGTSVPQISCALRTSKPWIRHWFEWPWGDYLVS